MTISIPVWALWTLAVIIGVPAVLSLFVFAAIGFQFYRGFRGW